MVIAMVTKEKKGQFEFRKLWLERQQAVHEETTTEIQAELTSVNAELAALENLVLTLPEGKAKKKASKQVAQLQFKKFMLGDRSFNYGSIELLNKELDKRITESVLTEVTAFLAEVATRKTELV
jgi:hypothetical protein